MNILGFFKERLDTLDVDENNIDEINNSAIDKFDKLFGDDNLDSLSQKNNYVKISLTDSIDRFEKLFDDNSSRTEGKIDNNSSNNVLSNINKISENKKIEKIFTDEEVCEPDYSEIRESNSKYEFNSNLYETDDNGYTYKKNNEIIPNNEYTVNGNKYRTDQNGNKISCESHPRYVEDGIRNIKEQRESGGEERREDDDGGHIIARVLGGSEGEENLVPMRRTINRGDYKRMENEMSKALQEGKEVNTNIELLYDGDSSRPSKIKAVYTIDDKRTICEFDNEECSIELLDLVKQNISKEDYSRLKENIREMREDGCDVSITSVRIDHNEYNNPTNITVGILEESTGLKRYKEYLPV